MKNRKREKILFISHDSSLTGAPILLLNLLGLLKKKSIIDFEILLYRGGYLEKEFKNLAPVGVLKSKDYSAKTHLIKRLIKYARYRLKLYKWKKNIENFDLIFSNTITNGRLLKTIRKSTIPIIAYIHELESVIEQNRTDALLTLKFSNIIAVPSCSVADNLKKNYNLNEQKLLRLNYFFPIKHLLPGSESKLEAREKFLKKYGLPHKKFLVACMGTATYRKGIDLFIEVAKELHSNPDIFHIWIGDFTDSATKEKIDKEIESNSLHQNFLLTGFLDYSQLNLLPFDIFVLTSREDPYPLVVLEAAFNEIPTISFASGGVSEFINEDCGWVVDTFSAKAMAGKILELKNDASQLILAGKNAYKKAIEIHSDEGRIISQFDNIIQTVYP